MTALHSTPLGVSDASIVCSDEYELVRVIRMELDNVESVTVSKLKTEDAIRG